MRVTAKNNKQLILQKFDPWDAENLARYFRQLSDMTKSLYGPHPFDTISILDIYTKHDNHIGYIAREVGNLAIIAYSVIRLGYLDQDAPRLISYGINPDPVTDATYAPSVADDWQSCGVGDNMFRFIYADLKSRGVLRIILWGGVQSSNEKAIKFYSKNGFRPLGHFEHNGDNTDMILEMR